MLRPSRALLLLVGIATLGGVVGEGAADGDRRRRGRQAPPAADVQRPSVDLRGLALRAFDADDAVAASARTQLRAAGPSGLAALRSTHAEAVAALEAGTAPPSAARERLRAALDAVAAQRDAHASGLFFHTDLDAARREARARGVPVLSLRLLGRLDEELSCANSRYFRTVLYSDPRVAERMRTQFVLHWSSERPAPRITIDMGDGRTLVRTLTGNSVHHVLDADGRVIDAIPGLYAPAQFLEALDGASAIAARCASAVGPARRDCIAAAHADTLRAVGTAWDARRVATPSLPTFAALASTFEAPVDRPSALDAMPLTVGKMIVESPVLDAVSRRRTQREAEGFDFRTLVADAVAPLAPRTRALVQLKVGRTDVDGLLSSLALTATADGLRNEVVLHAELHRWLSTTGGEHDFETWNARVYTELFRTPRSDPWLGLRAEDVWDAVEDVPPR